MAIGDVHGDLAAARAALRLAGASGDDGHWRGAGLVVVQVGDLIDRGDDDRRVLDWFEQLAAEAERAGGSLHWLNGNHELMNVAGDLRYASETSLAAFADVVPTRQAMALGAVPPRVRGRLAAFLPGGTYARRLAAHPCVLVVGDTVFAHAGLSSGDAEGVARLNNGVSRWMRGESASPPPEAQAQDGPLWMRQFGEDEPSAAACARLERILAGLHARRLVVGHTAQDEGIAPACAGRLYRIDVGLSQHRPGRPPQVLEIEGERITVRTAAP